MGEIFPSRIREAGIAGIFSTLYPISIYDGELIINSWYGHAMAIQLRIFPDNTPRNREHWVENLLDVLHFQLGVGGLYLVLH